MSKLQIIEDILGFYTVSYCPKVRSSGSYDKYSAVPRGIWGQFITPQTLEFFQNRAKQFNCGVGIDLCNGEIHFYFY